MKCDDCDEDIKGSYFQHEGRNICEKDYEAVRYWRNFVLHKHISTFFFAPVLAICKDLKILKTKQSFFLQKYRKKCCKCGNNISGSYYTTKDGTFKCSDCYRVSSIDSFLLCCFFRFHFVVMCLLYLFPQARACPKPQTL